MFSQAVSKVGQISDLLSDIVKATSQNQWVSLFAFEPVRNTNVEFRPTDPPNQARCLVAAAVSDTVQLCPFALPQEEIEIPSLLKIPSVRAATLVTLCIHVLNQ